MGNQLTLRTFPVFSWSASTILLVMMLLKRALGQQQNVDICKLPMKLTIERKELGRWLSLAQTENLTFHKVRKQVYDNLTASLKEKKGGSQSAVTMDFRTFQTLKNYLCCRNDKLTDEKELAFNESLLQLAAVLEEETEELQLAKAPVKSNSNGESDDDSPPDKGDNKNQNKLTLSEV